ncbi:alpha/beta fold hydrolase [Engelhardtia mirabilis]|uniref:Carboxylesterase A n=1 Tax=Engelhardtia mirabilis TaxID=2528011 RepID=A0A518BE04_9BACT|nr:Carboxylesterase A precursor [Planctomycetes bacterium Pla133]QDU99528.1 Carboxylesterase A precursor [Planctomycetes bacterium Pla86]
MIAPNLTLLAAAALSASPQASNSFGLELEPYTAFGPGGVELVGERGHFDVPLDHGDPDGPTLELAFVRFPSTNPDPGPPIVFLAGGPGASGIDYCVGPAAGRTLRLLDHGDVIGLDQRGTGQSEPDFDAGPQFVVELDPGRVYTRDEIGVAYAELVGRAADHWREAGFDLAHFNTTQNAADVDALRRALGLEQIVLYGSSYGSHLGLEVLRRHPDGVARALLGKVEGPDQTYKLPSTTQRFLEQLGELVRADPGVAEQMPDLVGTVAKLLTQLEEEPALVEVERNGEALRVLVSALDLRTMIAESLGLAFSIVELPAQIAALAAGDWSSMGDYTLSNRRLEVWSPMAIAMDCASGASKRRAAQIRRERRDPANLLSDAVNGPYPDLCESCGAGDVGDDFRKGARCEVPVLFVSGTIDARTPPANVEEILEHFPAAVHVICQNAGHEPIEILSREYVDLARAFLDGEAVESVTLELPQPRFKPIEVVREEP